MNDPAKSPRQRLSFNQGFRFHRGDAPDASDALSYERLRPWVLATGVELVNPEPRASTRPPGNPGGDVSFVQPEFDDSGWRELDLPHDFGIEGPFSIELPGATGKLPWHGVAWYRKRFELPAADAGRRIALDVDGAMSYSAVWLNGHFVGGWPYGYTSYRLDLTPFARAGADNVLVIRVDNPPSSSRWYPGGGIYRNVWLVKTGAVRVAHWGTFITTPHITKRRAVVNVDVVLENTTAADVEVTLTTTVHALIDGNRRGGKVLARTPASAVKLHGGWSLLRTQSTELHKPKLWSLEHRHRYVAVTRVEEDGALLDEVETPFGVRSVAVDADEGFLLNGERVPIQGVCMHHDLGALGTALHLRGLERQLEILQRMGVNAIRTSHNPPAPELLELCDRMGLLVMAEAFDCWRAGKNATPGVKEGEAGFEYLDYGRVFDDWYERDLRALVRRDRNHPSVVLWSIGNEIGEQWRSAGWKFAARLAGIVREEDRTRPVTSGLNADESAFNGFQTAVDVIGFNYKPHLYSALRESNPTMPVLGSETSSCVSSRGEYFFPVSDDKSQGLENFQVSSYDLCAPSWAFPPDREFRGLDEAPFAAGEFVWTGFDYLGEPTPYNADPTNLLNFSDPEQRARYEEELERIGRIRVPSRSSYFGIVDLAGFPKDRFYLYQARWRPDLKLAHILPHWNWPERVGEVTPVHVYSSGDEAELFLNGRSLGTRKRKRFEYRFRWDEVLYEPGELRVVTYRKGKKWAVATQRTTGAPAQLTLTADRTALTADGQDLAFITVAITDASGLTVPRTQSLIRFSADGPADLIAVDNGDPTSFESFQASERKAFNGLALAVLRTRRDTPGSVRFRAESQGLRPAELELTSAPPPARP